MSNQKNVGDAIVLTVNFKNTAGTLTDPTTITLEVKDPSGNTDTYTLAGGTVTKSSTGIYTKTISLDEAGWWSYEWTGTGTLAAVEGNKFYVYAQVIA